MEFSVTRRITETVNPKEDYFAAEMLERFNVSFNVENIIAADFLTAMQLRFAIGDVPDIMFPVRNEWALLDWISEGFVRGFTDAEIESMMPDYLPMWGDRWPTVRAVTAGGSGNVYAFHAPRPQATNQTWVFREDFMQAHNLSFSITIAELTEQMRLFRAETGLIPWVWNRANEPLNAINGANMPFNIPELAPRDLSHFDPRTGTFVPFAYTTQDWRDALIWLNMLHTEQLLWTEFAVATDEMRNAMWTQGHGYVNWFWVDRIERDKNPMTQQFDPNASWTWSPYMIANDPSQGAFFKHDPPHDANGLSFGSHLEGARLERAAYAISWLYTDEGHIFGTYGVEGIHYEINAQGLPEYINNVRSPINGAGDQLADWGFWIGVSWHPVRNAVYNPAVAALESQVNRNTYLYFPLLSLLFTEAEQRELADMTTTLRDEANTYSARFIMGSLDPNNDADWNSYISAMERLGLRRFEELRTQMFNRENQHVIGSYGR
jgi:ABC-type glycerol-3-phosphate transport system substrate-binding protein